MFHEHPVHPCLSSSDCAFLIKEITAKCEKISFLLSHIFLSIYCTIGSRRAFEVPSFALQSLKESNQGHFRLIPITNAANFPLNADFTIHFSADLLRREKASNNKKLGH